MNWARPSRGGTNSLNKSTFTQHVRDDAQSIKMNQDIKDLIRRDDPLLVLFPLGQTLYIIKKEKKYPPPLSFLYPASSKGSRSTLTKEVITFDYIYIYNSRCWTFEHLFQNICHFLGGILPQKSTQLCHQLINFDAHDHGRSLPHPPSVFLYIYIVNKKLVPILSITKYYFYSYKETQYLDI